MFSTFCKHNIDKLLHKGYNKIVVRYKERRRKFKRLMTQMHSQIKYFLMITLFVMCHTNLYYGFTEKIYSAFYMHKLLHKRYDERIHVRDEQRKDKSVAD